MLLKYVLCADFMILFYGLGIVYLLDWRHHFVRCKQMEPPPPTPPFSSNDIVAQFNLPMMAPTASSSLFGNRTNNVENSADSQSKNYFTHLTYDLMNNVLFAGATNKILKLNENLRVLSEAVTGPLNDSPQCHAGGCNEDIETSLVNNYNKILVVSYAHDGILISCGSTRQGNLYVILIVS